MLIANLQVAHVILEEAFSPTNIGRGMPLLSCKTLTPQPTNMIFFLLKFLLAKTTRVVGKKTLFSSCQPLFFGKNLSI